MNFYIRHYYGILGLFWFRVKSLVMSRTVDENA